MDLTLPGVGGPRATLSNCWGRSAALLLLGSPLEPQNPCWPSLPCRFSSRAPACLQGQAPGFAEVQDEQSGAPQAEGTPDVTGFLPLVPQTPEVTLILLTAPRSPRQESAPLRRAWGSSRHEQGGTDVSRRWLLSLVCATGLGVMLGP